MPWTLISIFPQAISKTASCVTSLTLHFFKQLCPYIYFKSLLSSSSLLSKTCCAYSWRIWSLTEQWNQTWIIGLTSQAGWRRGEKRRAEESRGEGLRASFTNLTLCPSLPARKHWACKSFGCKGLGQPPLAPFQKSTACFRKTEGTSLLGGVLALCTLPRHPLSLSGTQGSDHSQDFHSLLSG